jgi:hypothetical protein
MSFWKWPFCEDRAIKWMTWKFALNNISNLFPSKSFPCEFECKFSQTISRGAFWEWSTIDPRKVPLLHFAKICRNSFTLIRFIIRPVWVFRGNQSFYFVFKLRNIRFFLLKLRSESKSFHGRPLHSFGCP